jgi:uncharacterized Ntn-hydrolase superfamily protein
MEQPEIDIRVDLHTQAVSQLRYVFETYQAERGAQQGSGSATHSTRHDRIPLRAQ